MKTVARFVAALAALWLVIGTVDIMRVAYSFNKPFFAVPKVTADDGGSGYYVGAGWAFDIEGRFMPDAVPEDDPHPEYLGVTRYRVYLFGREVAAGRKYYD